MEEKSCINCKYFIQYYIKRGLRLREANCGHCINHNRKSLRFCKDWQEVDLKEIEEKTKASAQMFLKDMAKRLEEILIILDYNNEQVKTDAP